MKPVKTEEAGADLLPKEMNGMTISDDKVDGHNDKVSISFPPIVCWPHGISAFGTHVVISDYRKLKGLLLMEMELRQDRSSWQQ
jgi:hypothetical protein